jgi:uncharacterized protein
MALPRSAERLTIYLTQTQHQRHVPVYVKIIERAREVGMAGATVLQGIEGFGGSSTLHRRRAIALSEDVPVVVTIVDTTDRIEAFLTEITTLAPQALVLRSAVEVVVHRTPGGIRRGGRTDPGGADIIAE